MIVKNGIHPKSKVRSSIGNILLLAISLLVIVAIVEITLRVFPSLFPVIPIVHLKNHTHEMDTIQEESKRPLRILILGDSFCIKNTSFPHKLVSMIHQPVDVYKLCESGIGPDIYLQFYQMVKQGLNPDIVIMSFYVGNDITNLLDWVESPDKERIKQFFGENFRAYHLIRWLYSTVHYRLLYSKLHAQNLPTAVDAKKIKTVRSDRNMVAVVNPFLQSQAKIDPRILKQNLFISAQRIEKSWQVFEGLLQDFINDRDARRRYILLAIPDANQVNAVYHDFFTAIGFTMDAEMLSSNLPQARLANLTRKYHIDFFDVLPDFRKKDHRALYFLNDAHLNPYGQEYLAGLIAERLQKR